MATAFIEDITQWGYSLPLEMNKPTTWGWFTGEAIPGGVGTPGGELIPNHVERSLDLFIEQFEEKTTLQGYEAAILNMYQDIEAVLQDMKRDMYNLAEGTGDRLDIIGDIVGEPRNGRTDDEYRIALELRIRINNSNGEPEVVRAACIAFTQATSVKLVETFPAGIDLLINTIFVLPPNLITSLEKIASSGVRLRLYLTDGEPDFAFAGEGGFPPEPNTLGFGETGIGNESIGGKFIELI